MKFYAMHLNYLSISTSQAVTKRDRIERRNGSYRVNE